MGAMDFPARMDWACGWSPMRMTQEDFVRRVRTLCQRAWQMPPYSAKVITDAQPRRRVGLHQDLAGFTSG